MKIISFAFFAPASECRWISFAEETDLSNKFIFKGRRMVFASIFEHASSVFVFASSKHSLEHAR